MASCRSCNAPIIWARTANGKAIPLNVERSIAGNIAFDGVTARYVTPDANAVPMRYTSHFATCPNAKAHRKPKGPTP